jgi:hypothetical protein
MVLATTPVRWAKLVGFAQPIIRWVKSAEYVADHLPICADDAADPTF